MIGNIPDEWRVEKVKNIVKITKGKKVEIFEEYQNGLFNYIDISVLRNGKYKYTDNHQIMATDKDILIVWDGANSGYSAFGLNGVVGSTLAKMTLNDKDILHTYFGKFIFGKFQYLNDTSYGATIPHLQRQTLESINVPIPPLTQQEKIVKVLDISSALIEKQKELIEKYALFLKSKFIEMFGDPISNPMGWNVEKLEKFTTLVSSGSTPKGGQSSYLDEGEIRFIRSQNVRMNKMDYDGIYYIAEEVYDKMKRTQVQYNDVLLNITGASIGRTAIYKDTSRANVNQHVCIIRLNEQLNNIYLNYFISADSFQNRILANQSGATREALNFTQIKQFNISYPPMEQQSKFAQIVEKTEQIKQQEVQKLEHLRVLHNSLMNKAFKGEII